MPLHVTDITHFVRATIASVVPFIFTYSTTVQIPFMLLTFHHFCSSHRVYHHLLWKRDGPSSYVCVLYPRRFLDLSHIVAQPIEIRAARFQLFKYQLCISIILILMSHQHAHLAISLHDFILVHEYNPIIIKVPHTFQLESIKLHL